MLFSTDPPSRFKFLAAGAIVVLISACGGGGGSSSGSTPPANGGGTTPPPSGIVSPMGCGTVTSTGTGNTTPVVVDGFPCAVDGTAGIANSPQQPFISVKVCSPGSTTNCQIIDHIILDTGSTGLRIAASALQSTLKPGAGLPYYTASSPNGTNLTECETYVASYVYGPVVNVDVYIADESAKGTQMQVFGVSGFPVPSDPNGCSTGAGTETNSIVTFNGNGLLGVNFALFDGGVPYYDCAGATANCTPNINPNFLGIPNIVSQFASNNNGVAISLPKLATTESDTPVVGTLMFGIGTQQNNTPQSGTLAIQNDAGGTFAVQVDGGSWTSAYIDSGTGISFFADTQNKNLTVCPSSSNFTGWYCPTSTQSVTLNYANFGSTSTLGTTTLSVANPNYLTGNSIAFNNVAGTNSSQNTINSEVALGLTTFFGHTNYFLFAGKTAPGTNLGGGTTAGPINGID